MRVRSLLLTSLAAFAVSVTPAMAERPEAKDPNPKTLALLEERAESPGDYRELGALHERRAETLEEKAARHDRLAKRYASVPASLLAKRGRSWDTPRRQKELAREARHEAAEARRQAESFYARADPGSETVD